MTVDCVDSAGDVADDFDDIDWRDLLDLPLWNGREIALLSHLVELDHVISQIHSFSNQKTFQFEERVQVGCRCYETLNLWEDSSEEPRFEFAQYVQPQFAVYYPTDHEFRLADAAQLKPEIIDCKNMFSRAWKGVKKGGKRIGKGIEKGAKKTAHFVKEHKKEILIAAAVVAAVAGGIVIAGALGGAAVGDAANSRRKEGDDPHSPDGKDPAPANPPPPDPANPVSSSLIPDLNRSPIPEKSPLLPPVSEAFQSDISRHMGDLQLSRSGFELPDFHAPSELFHDRNRENLTATAGDVFSKPASSAGVSSIPSVDTLFQMVWGAIRSGLDTVGRSVTAPEMQDPHLPVNFFSKDEIDRLKSTETSLASIPPQDRKLDSDVFSNLKSTFGTLLDSLQRSPGMLNPDEVAPFGTDNQPARSMCFNTAGDRKDGMKVMFINGVGNSLDDAKGNAEHIRSVGNNLRVDGIYNKSNGAIFDTFEALLLNYQGYSPVTQNLLMNEWTNFHIENMDKPDAKILHFCHSQGAIHTYNALMRLPKEIRDRIIVVAIAPAIVIPEGCCFDSYNYVSQKDLVHYGQDFVTYFAANTNEALRDEMLSCLVRNKDQLIVLEPNGETDWLDHGFKNQTYMEQIRDHLDDYRDHNGEYK